MKEGELVSVLLLTYNTSRLVVEALESIMNQTYKALGLIISDDCSTDDTLQHIEDWLDTNRSGFSITPILNKNDKNPGIARNCNAGLKYTSGKWIKLSAGDDLLDGNCIQSFVDSMCEPDSKIFVISSVRIFSNNLAVPDSVWIPRSSVGTNKHQLERFLIDGAINAPEVFVYLAGGSIFLLSSTFSLKELDRRIGIQPLFRNKFKRAS